MNKNKKILNAYKKYQQLKEKEKNKFVNVFRELLENYPLYQVINIKELKKFIKEVYLMQIEKENFVESEQNQNNVEIKQVDGENNNE